MVPTLYIVFYGPIIELCRGLNLLNYHLVTHQPLYLPTTWQYNCR